VNRITRLRRPDYTLETTTEVTWGDDAKPDLDWKTP
jgi:hypothetical protein